MRIIKAHIMWCVCVCTITAISRIISCAPCACDVHKQPTECRTRYLIPIIVHAIVHAVHSFSRCVDAPGEVVEVVVVVLLYLNVLAASGVARTTFEHDHRAGAMCKPCLPPRRRNTKTTIKNKWNIVLLKLQSEMRACQNPLQMHSLLESPKYYLCMYVLGAFWPDDAMWRAMLIIMMIYGEGHVTHRHMNMSTAESCSEEEERGREKLCGFYNH